MAQENISNDPTQTLRGMDTDLVTNQYADMTQNIFTRDFVSADIANKLIGELPITSITIDIWANSIREYSVLDPILSIEKLAERIVRTDSATELAKVLANQGVMDSILNGLLPGNSTVHYNRPMFSRFFTFEVVNNVVKDGTVAMIVADLLNYILSDLGVISMNTGRNHFQLSRYYGPFPDEHTFVNELKRAEVEKLLQLTQLVLKREGRTAEYSGIIKERVLDLLRPFSVQLRRIGEVADQFEDLLDIIRTRISPDLYATTGVDKDLLENAAVVDLSMDATFVAMAVSRKRKYKRKLSDLAMFRALDNIISKIRDTTRFKRISKSEYAEKFSKKTIKNNHGEFVGVIINRNSAVSPAAQVVDTLIYNATPARQEIINQPVLEGFMQSAYGNVHTVLSTKHAANLLAEEYSKYASDSFAGKQAFDQVTILGKVQANELMILAMTKADRVYLMSHDGVAEADALYSLAFAKDINGLPYTVVTGAEIGSASRITDPAELLMLSEDWDGTYTEMDRIQTYPREVVNFFVYDSKKIFKLEDMNTEYFASVKVGEEEFSCKSTFLDMVGRSYLTDNAIVVPEHNVQVTSTYVEALQMLWDLSTKMGDHSGIYAMSTQAMLARELDALFTSLNQPAVDQIKAYMRDTMIFTSEKGQRHASSQLRRAAFEVQLRYHASIILMRKMGILQGSSPEETLRNIRDSHMFAVTYGVN